MIARMEADGIIGPTTGTTPRQLLIQSPQQAKKVIRQFGYNGSAEKAFPMNAIDGMEGHEFEYYVADLLKNLDIQMLRSQRVLEIKVLMF